MQALQPSVNTKLFFNVMSRMAQETGSSSGHRLLCFGGPASALYRPAVRENQDKVKRGVLGSEYMTTFSITKSQILLNSLYNGIKKYFFKLLVCP